MPEAIRSGARSPTIAALTLGVAIDYFRWTQLVPMIAAWTFLLVWLVSLYSLGVGYLLERLKRAISGADEATGGVDNTDRPT